MPRLTHVFASIFFVLLISIQGHSIHFTDENEYGSYDSEKIKNDYRRPSVIPFPKSNPYTLEKATLGKMLFFDQRLSGGQNMSCATCHNPSFGWEVPFPTAIGAQNQKLDRHAPTVLSMAWVDSFFWDGRAATLEEQAGGPITSEVEMNLPLEELVERLKGIPAYVSGFALAFPSKGISEDSIKKAIATYERTIVPNNSPFDNWLAGDDDAISASAQRGFDLFNTKAQCSTCHSGWNFSDNQFYDIGLASEDIGRFKEDGSNPKNRHAFKTPGLRNLTQRAPFMHDGSLQSLEDVVIHYVSGGVERPSRSEHIGPLNLNDTEVTDLVAFLESLTAEREQVVLPILPN
ncbi:cytochrome-c peroxidase [Kordiimonas sp. SCSIO 12610]|uniref:cytochrome-c peroxidase n=1 Tax=Kordiimonas sp. SCSIO 12610 TaxID=2829597 RepID=UPI00210D4BD1|nr:cytochrome c peroxidase [Kordiimonas sp. SCSIO 12610]UTW56350.1 c-type cytochrome [Kordiimonas sp. SCSIO 12610]